MKPTDIVNTVTDKHLKKAADAIRQMFKPGEFLQPSYEKRVTLKLTPGTVAGEKVWRFAWPITATFLKASHIIGGTPPNISDVKHRRVYVLDVHAENIIDYIVPQDEAPKMHPRKGE